MTEQYHRHSFEELFRCCESGGTVDLSKVECHRGSCGSNGGVPCDVDEGPCSCGAWHMRTECEVCGQMVTDRDMNAHTTHHAHFG